MAYIRFIIEEKEVLNIQYHQNPSYLFHHQNKQNLVFEEYAPFVSYLKKRKNFSFPFYLKSAEQIRDHFQYQEVYLFNYKEVIEIKEYLENSYSSEFIDSWLVYLNQLKPNQLFVLIQS